MTKTPNFIDPRLPRHESEILICEILGISRTKLYLEQPSFTPAQKNKIIALQKKIADGYPLQYATRKANFIDLELFVNENVLIPRPETELLAEKALEFKAKNILEVGCGSGCIIIYLAKNQKGKFTATDISLKALSVAKRNAEKCKARIDFKKSDLFQNLKGKKFDLIIANLPYGTKSQLKNVQHEPKLAVYGGKNGFEIIERFLNEVKNHLARGATILLEIDPSQSDLLKQSAVSHGFKIEIIKDLNNRDRIGILNQNPF